MTRQQVEIALNRACGNRKGVRVNRLARDAYHWISVDDPLNDNDLSWLNSVYWVTRRIDLRDYGAGAVAAMIEKHMLMATGDERHLI